MLIAMRGDNQKKRLLDTMHRDFCYKCFRPKSNCFCEFIKPFYTKTKFVILMHPKEARKQKTGTGRLTKIALKNSEIIIGTDFTQNARINNLINDSESFVTLLYPGRNSIDASQINNCIDLSNPINRRLVVILIDGTWPEAKKMMKFSKNLHDLSRISFKNNVESKFLIKQQPGKLCLSTIEATYYLLEGLKLSNYEKIDDKHSILLKTLERLNNFQIACASDPNLRSYRNSCYKDSAQRTPAKKWQKRKIFFDIT